MSYDLSVPSRLKKTQQWFASIITRAIDEDSRMNPIAPSGQPMEQESAVYIAPSPTLKPAERIQIYNQQYWWRLLSTLHESFPLVTRLFGYHDFNQLIAVPYLLKYPPNHWSLNCLGDRLPRWVDEEYKNQDKLLISHAASIDWALGDSFVAPDEAVEQDLSTFSDKPLHLHSSVHLFEMPYDLFQFRAEFLKEDPDYWVEHDFPQLIHEPEGQLAFYIVFRNSQNNVEVEKLSKGEYLVLRQFAAGATVDALCDWLDEQKDANLCSEASQKLHLWFQRWIAHQWLVCKR